jgi:hypothetical protein
MDRYKEAWHEHQRRRFLRPDGYRWWRPDADRYLGADLERHMHPDVYARWLHDNGKEPPEQKCAIDPAIAREAEAIRACLDVLRAELAAIRRDRLKRKSHHWLTEPRVPAGNADGGQWTNGFALAGMPRIPGRRPPTGPERTGVAKELAIWLAEMGLSAFDIIAKTSWLYDAIPNIVSYLDAPKSLAELQDSVATSKAGYDVHHIVERASAAEDGYPIQRIDRLDNLARIPRMKH